MKILAFTDNHTLNSNLIAKKAKDVDLVISLGDMSLMGNYLEQQFKWMNNLGKKVLVIPGNHEEFTNFHKMIKKYKNLINMHMDTFEIDDAVFIGFGGGGFAEEEPEFRRLEKMFSKAIDNAKISFLLTHAPPYGTELDYLPRFEPAAHRGVKCYRIFIEKYQPTYALSGHLHETFEMKDKIGKTICWNVGDEGIVFDV